MPKTIHIGGCSGVAGIGLTRCLKDQGYNVKGHDDSPWGKEAAECEFDDGGGIHMADMLIPVPDALVRKYAEHANTFLPCKEIIELCQELDCDYRIIHEVNTDGYMVNGVVVKSPANDLMYNHNLYLHLKYNGGRNE